MNASICNARHNSFRLARRTCSEQECRANFATSSALFEASWEMPYSRLQASRCCRCLCKVVPASPDGINWQPRALAHEILLLFSRTLSSAETKMLSFRFFRILSTTSLPKADTRRSLQRGNFRAVQTPRKKPKRFLRPTFTQSIPPWWSVATVQLERRLKRLWNSLD